MQQNISKIYFRTEYIHFMIVILNAPKINQNQSSIDFRRRFCLHCYKGAF